jgi:hypothetical protein
MSHSCSFGLSTKGNSFVIFQTIMFKNKKFYKINEHNLNDRPEVSTTSSIQAHLCWDIKKLEQYNLQGMTNSLPKNNTEGSSWENGCDRKPHSRRWLKKTKFFKVQYCITPKQNTKIITAQNKEGELGRSSNITVCIIPQAHLKWFNT